jgi:hypothetical protein
MEMTPALLTAGQKLQRYFEVYMEFSRYFKVFIHLYLKVSRGTLVAMQ